MRMKLLLPMIVAGALAGCAKPGAFVSQRPVVGAVAETLTNPDGLDRQASDLLRQEGLLTTFRRDPAAAIRQLDQRWKADLTESRRVALAGVCTAAAGRSGADEAPGFLLAAAEFAWPLAIAGQTTADRRRGRAIHSHCSGEMAESLFEKVRLRARSLQIPGPIHPYRLRMTTPGIDPVQPESSDTLIRASRLKLRKMNVPRHRVEGIGADLVLHRVRTPERLLADPMLNRSGLALPLNANLVFGGTADEVKLEINDLTLTRSVRLGGRSQPLSADFTAPYAVLLNHTEMSSGLFGLKALFNTTDYDHATGLYQVEPWREDQIPLIFVHGLASSPVTWLKVFNEFTADPQLQKTYQLMAFRYPTGYPIGRNATSLRHRLREMRKSVDPDHNNPAIKKAVLVGHSMGGILSNLQIRSSGEQVRKLYVDRPIDQLDIDDERKRQLKEMAHFDADPNIRRAVFIASPHRGSKIADNPLGRLGSWLIRLPLDVVTLGLTGRRIQGVTALGEGLLNTGNDSIKTLQPDNPVLATTLELPLGPGVRYHSIIGNHRMTAPLEESSDTVVAYWSAHLDDATSEKVVDATHLNILRDDEAIEELRRLLYLHAGLKYGR